MESFSSNEPLFLATGPPCRSVCAGCRYDICLCWANAGRARVCAGGPDDGSRRRDNHTGASGPSGDNGLNPTLSWIARQQAISFGRDTGDRYLAPGQPDAQTVMVIRPLRKAPRAPTNLAAHNDFDGRATAPDHRRSRPARERDTPRPAALTNRKISSQPDRRRVADLSF